MKVSPRGKLATTNDRIVRFLRDNDIVLSGEEAAILARYQFAERLIQQRRSFTHVIEELKREFSISRFTAQNDYFQAQQIFGQAMELDKTYILFHKFQRQQEDIEKVRAQMMENESWNDPKLLQALAKMEEAATYTLNSIPVRNTDPLPKSPIMLFQLFNNRTINAPMPINEAMQAADEYLKDVNNGEGF